MPYTQIPINAKPYKNIDDILNANGSSDALVDGYIDEAGFTNKRPGIDATVFVDLQNTHKVDGLYWWTSRKILIAVCGQRIYKITDPTGSFQDLTSAKLVDGVKPTFVDYGDNLLIANGTRLVYTNSVIPTAYLTDVDAPQNPTHVAFMDTYLIANFPGTGEFGYSNVANFQTWDALDFAVTEGNPDNGVALLVDNGKIYIISERSIEIFYNDGVTPFARLGQSFIDSGCIAKYTCVFIQGNLYYLDHNRKIVRMNGSVPQIISTPFDRVIQDLETVNDAFGEYYQVDGKMFYVVTFPTEDFTIVYDIISDAWYQWGYWDTTNHEYKRFRPNCYVYCPEWGIHVIGDSETGKLYKFGRAYNQDITNPIRLLKRTGHIDHGSYINKRSNGIIMKVRSGAVDAGKLTIRWKNDGNNLWGNFHDIDLKNRGVTNFIATMSRCGTYRSRQYEITHTDDAPLSIAGFEEDVEGLRG